MAEDLWETNIHVTWFKLLWRKLNRIRGYSAMEEGLFCICWSRKASLKRRYLSRGLKEAGKLARQVSGDKHSTRCKGPGCFHATRNNRSKCGLNERRKGKVVGEGVRKVAVGGGAIMWDLKTISRTLVFFTERDTNCWRILSQGVAWSYLTKAILAAGGKRLGTG